MKRDKQWAFNCVWDWFIVKKNGQSAERPDPNNNSYLRCYYRGPKNTRCAAGCLIPDELYQASFERLNIRTLFDERKIRDYFKDVDPLFLRKLQVLHDECHLVTKRGFLNHMRKGMIKLAESDHLTVPVEGNVG